MDDNERKPFQSSNRGSAFLILKDLGQIGHDDHTPYSGEEASKSGMVHEPDQSESDLNSNSGSKSVEEHSESSRESSAVPTTPTRRIRETSPSPGPSSISEGQKGSSDITSKKIGHKILCHGRTQLGNNLKAPEENFAIPTRRHLEVLRRALRIHWTCSCQECSGLSFSLSLSQNGKVSMYESCFQVFFGVQRSSTTIWREANITVKVREDDTAMRSHERLETAQSSLEICPTITKLLEHPNCLNLLLENDRFERGHPKAQSFSNSPLQRLTTLSDLFTRQQELRGGTSVISLKGKRILAVTLAAALMPFIETPWVFPSFNHSNIQFFQPLQDGKLPSITKPFLAVADVPYNSASQMHARTNQTNPLSPGYFIHSKPSLLALAVMLCELQYCTPIENWQNKVGAARTQDTDYNSCKSMLKTLEADSGSNYQLAVLACLEWERVSGDRLSEFGSDVSQKTFYQEVVKRLELEIFQRWNLTLDDLSRLDDEENELCWGNFGQEMKQGIRKGSSATGRRNSEPPLRPVSTVTGISNSTSDASMFQRGLADQNSGDQSRHSIYADDLRGGASLYNDIRQNASELDFSISRKWMKRLFHSIHCHIHSYHDALQLPTRGTKEKPRPVRIAILDSGFDPTHESIKYGEKLDPRIKETRNFVDHEKPEDVQDETGHGTHTLGSLYNVARCSEIYIARVGRGQIIHRNNYDSVVNAIHHAVDEWGVDIICMPFGIHESNRTLTEAVADARHQKCLMFAAASNEGANRGRAFPARYPGVFCIHSTDGYGNPSAFNPTADKHDVNFSLLGENVESHWPPGIGGHEGAYKVSSGTSNATSIAAGLAASILSFVRQQEEDIAPERELLGPWLKDDHSMNEVLKFMTTQRGAGYDYIDPQLLFDFSSTKEQVYNRIKDIKARMYR